MQHQLTYQDEEVCAVSCCCLLDSITCGSLQLRGPATHSDERPDSPMLEITKNAWHGGPNIDVVIAAGLLTQTTPSRWGRIKDLRRSVAGCVEAFREVSPERID